MKIELIKEQQVNDAPWYSIKIDDQLVSGTFTRDIDKAQSNYEKLCKDPNCLKETKEILKSQEIVVS